jgi:hypothetical protein
MELNDLVSIGIAIGVVYLFAWLLNMDPNITVGWVALGIAATR